VTEFAAREIDFGGKNIFIHDRVSMERDCEVSRRRVDTDTIRIPIYIYIYIHTLSHHAKPESLKKKHIHMHINTCDGKIQ